MEVADATSVGGFFYIFKLFKIERNFINRIQILTIMQDIQIREFIAGMCGRFERDVAPLINTGNYKIAAGQLEQIINLLKPKEKEIRDLPSGINYIISIGFLYKSLINGKKPTEKLMEEYNGYCAQVQMPRIEGTE